ncbi:hypothetical protein [Cellulomonas chengniuliangii]|uniref:hypothetical protein n=1 Tax=Cellulomonas chengniuliangii TaxID=2968084 RepID=UPI001D0EAE91|nr:hypothetical protein [Cellulomonas chengniuliangii]MCC2317558.1 hypothetical protein [Cellulomonas chengniuliangii]
MRITVVALLVVGAVAGVAELLTGGPGPRLDEVRTEAILVAPVPAAELGRREQQSQWGLGLPDSHAFVDIAYQVAGTPEEAVSAWTQAYGRQYGLKARSSRDPITLVGSSGEIVVSVRVGTTVELPDSERSDFALPAEGSTVVTVTASAG